MSAKRLKTDRLIDFRAIGVELGAAAVMVLVLVSAHGYLTGGGITIEYDVYPGTAGRTQVYWSTGGNLSEDKQVARAIHADGRNHVRVHIIEKSAIKWVRIDPLKAPGTFAIRNIRLDYMGALLPFRSFGHWDLGADEAAKSHQLERRGAREWKATGNDPYFLFQVPEIFVFTIFLFNLLLALALVTAVVLCARLTGFFEKSREQSMKHHLSLITPLAIYGSFFVMALMSSHFTSIRGHSRVVVYVVLVVWIVSTLLIGRGLASGRFARATSGLLAIAIVTLPDILFHLGVAESPMFSRFHTPLYHWQLGKTPRDNFVNSSLRYYRDFRAIASMIVPGSYFISDVATSYYASAALPLYAVNVLPHHRYGVVPISPRIVAELCDKNEARDSREFHDYFERKRRTHEANRLDPLRYWLANKDKENRHVRADCLSRRHDLVKKRLASLLTPIYVGAYIDVYEFRDP